MSVLKLDVVVLVGVVDVLVLHLGCFVVGISENHGVVWFTVPVSYRKEQTHRMN